VHGIVDFKIFIFHFDFHIIIVYMFSVQCDNSVYTSIFRDQARVRRISMS
jgi:hypothetical protein